MMSTGEEARLLRDRAVKLRASATAHATAMSHRLIELATALELRARELEARNGAAQHGPGRPDVPED
jgi:hypothetical protein